MLSMYLKVFINGLSLIVSSFTLKTEHDTSKAPNVLHCENNTFKNKTTEMSIIKVPLFMNFWKWPFMRCVTQL